MHVANPVRILRPVLGAHVGCAGRAAREPEEVWSLMALNRHQVWCDVATPVQHGLVATKLDYSGAEKGGAQ